MIQTKTVAMLLLIAIATVWAIWITAEMGIQSAQAWQMASTSGIDVLGSKPLSISIDISEHRTRNLRNIC